MNTYCKCHIGCCVSSISQSLCFFRIVNSLRAYFISINILHLSDVNLVCLATRQTFKWMTYEAEQNCTSTTRNILTAFKMLNWQIINGPEPFKLLPGHREQACWLQAYTTYLDKTVVLTITTPENQDKSYPPQRRTKQVTTFFMHTF